MNLENLEKHINLIFIQLNSSSKNVKVTTFNDLEEGLVNGIERSIHFDTYFVSDAKGVMTLDDIPDISKVWDLEGGKFIENPSFELKKAYRVIQNKDTGEKALIEISQDPRNKIQNPIGWLDGVIVGGKVFRNAMLTSRQGRLLSSMFFDVADKKFKLRLLKDMYDEFKKNLHNNIITDNDKPTGKRYGIKVLFVISSTEMNGHANILVDLDITNPAFIDESLDMHYATKLKGGFLDDVKVPTHRSMKKYTLTRETVQKWKGLFKGRKMDNYIISQEEAIQTVFNLFLFREQESKSYNYYILDKLGKFNTIVDSETIFFDSFRDQQIIEDTLNELYDSKDKIGLWKFCTKNSAGTIISPNSYSLKQWMSELYGKIISYTGDNKLILEAKYELIDIANTICELDSDPNNYLFTDKEVEAGKAMFKVFNHLFGHFTVRLIMMGMFDWYLKPKTETEPERIKILINTRSDWETTRESIRRYCMVPSSKYIPYVSVPLGESRMKTQDIYSLLFGDSHLFLPTSKRNELTGNAVLFGYSLVEIIDGRTTIYSLYKKFKSQTPKVELYTRSCEAMLKVVEDAIEERVESDPSINPSKRDTKIKEYTELAKEQIFVPGKAAHVRLAIEKLMKSRLYKSVQGIGKDSQRIEIHIIKRTLKKDETYEIFINKDDLTGLNIQTWGNIHVYYSKGEIWNQMANRHPDDPFWTK